MVNDCHVPASVIKRDTHALGSQNEIRHQIMRTGNQLRIT